MSRRELPARGRRVLLAGDSTVAPYVAPDFPLCGWGAHLGAALNALLPAGEGPVHVVDLAKNGATTRSHREEGLWDALLGGTTAGDAVILQFGHNDQKHADLDAAGGYTAHLARMIHEIRERGAQPVLCTPVARRHYAEGRLLETHGAYPQAVHDLGRTLGVPVLDLHAETRTLILDLGEEGSQRLFGRMAPGESPLRPDGLVDDTHFSIDGAIAVADLVAPLLAPLLVPDLAPVPAAQRA